MKGVVFTEFIEMVEDRFSIGVADKIIEASDLPSGGAYTAVGTYDYQELVQLVTNLSTATGIAVPDLVREFGRYLFGRFSIGYAHFFAGVESTFDFLENVEKYIHIEVQKLYPEAELPTFEYIMSKPGHLTLIYHSKRALPDLAEGLIIGCIEYFGEQIDIDREDLSGGQGTVVRFSLTQ